MERENKVRGLLVAALAAAEQRGSATPVEARPTTAREARQLELVSIIRTFVASLPQELQAAPMKFDAVSRYCAEARGVAPRYDELSAALQVAGFRAQKIWAGGRGRWVWSRRPNQD
jgi:hypothetical protein